MEIYKDEVYEQSMKNRLELSRQLFQDALNTWLKLDLKGCSGSAELYDIIFFPEVAYQEGCNVKQLPPEGVSEKVKREHAARVKLPNPNKFYQAAEKAGQDQYAARELSLFGVKGSEVVINDKPAEPIIKARSVYANSDTQKTFHKDLDKMLALLNKLNAQTYGAVLAQDLQKQLTINPRDNGDFNPVSFQPERLKELISIV